MSRQRTPPGVPAGTDEGAGQRVSSRLILMGLGYIMLSTLIVGGWAQLAPRSFYDDFPGLGFAWVGVDGPYNEHPIRDVGGGYLAVAAVALLALPRPRVALTRVTAVATLVARTPHLLYHIGTIDLLLTALEQALQMVSLASLVALPMLLLWGDDDATGSARGTVAADKSHHGNEAEEHAMTEKSKSVEHDDAGEPDDEVPGTGIFEDETLVTDLDEDGDGVPGIYPGPPAHTGGEAEPGPAPADEAEEE